MKSYTLNFLLLFFYLCLSDSSLQAQDNPYEIFGHESKVEYKTSVKELLYVVNPDTTSAVYALAFDLEVGEILFLNAADSVLDVVQVKREHLYIWLSTDPMAHKRESLSPYNFVQNNPMNRIDPTGALDNPIYDTNGNFLGTDNRGLQGEARIMSKNDFTQGMNHNVATYLSYGMQGLKSSEARNKVENHFFGLINRPDYDGYVSLSEGVHWALSHPGALQSPTPDNTLYIDASKLDLGNTYLNEFANKIPGQIAPANTFTKSNLLAAVGNEKIRASVYALGRVNIRLENWETRTVSIVNDAATGYDWNEGGNFMRDKFIRAERFRTGLNDSHGFEVFYYGVVQLNRPFEPEFPNFPGMREYYKELNSNYYETH